MQRKYYGMEPKRRATLIAIAVSAIVVLLLTAIFVPTYFFGWHGNVSETEYGLKYSTFESQLVDEIVYEPGRYYLGAVGRFIIFPKVQITLEFQASNFTEITARTQDGLAVSLDVSFQYLLRKDKVLDLYRTFGTSYQEIFLKIARDSLRDASSQYDALEFFTNRTEIGTFMGDLLSEALTEFVTVPSLQLRGIDLPDSFENALQEVEVARQGIAKAQEDQARAVIEATTKILEANAARNVTLINANATAEAFLLDIKAQAEGVNITITQEAESFFLLGRDLGLNATELLTYLWIQALEEIGNQGNLVVVGQESPNLLINPSDTTP